MIGTEEPFIAFSAGILLWPVELGLQYSDLSQQQNNAKLPQRLKITGISRASACDSLGAPAVIR